MSLVRTVKLRVPAGAARPGPAIGQALGPLGINMAEFCKQFNDRTNAPPKGQPAYAQNTPLSVELFAMSDRSFDFHVKSPSVSYLLRQACAQLGPDKKGPNQPNAETNPVGFVTPEVVYEIAKVKQSDPGIIGKLPLESIAKSIVGTARSIGIQVREAPDE